MTNVPLWRCPWEPAPHRPATPPTALLPPKPKGRRPEGTILPAGEAAPFWLYHHLTLSGPAEPVAAFAAAARGSGIIPWPFDGNRIEEDVFNLAVSPPLAQRRLSVAGCRRLARQFRDRAEARHGRAMALFGHSQACPFDLHRLLPIPDDLLQQGPADPALLAWLTEHWGLTDMPRKIVLRSRPNMGRRLPAGHKVIGYDFFTDGPTPQAAIDRLGSLWPELRFRLQSRPLA
jgi:hypothetical protein